MQVGVTLIGLGVIGGALAPSVPILLLFRMLMGIGTALSLSPD